MTRSCKKTVWSIEGKGTASAICTLTTIIEQSNEIQQDFYFCFIDFTKAFDTVKH